MTQGEPDIPDDAEPDLKGRPSAASQGDSAT
jgi:hypothetical protein